MYENYFQFKEKPFSLTPDPKFLYLSKQYQGALDHMLYGIKQREGFMVIAGDVGTGKTTLCRCLLDRLDEDVEVALILNPMLSDMDLLRNIVHDLQIEPVKAQQPAGIIEDESTGDSIEIDLSDEIIPSEDLRQQDHTWINNASKKELIDALNGFLLNRHEQGRTTVLIVDEAQNLSLDVMEQVRILSNIETEKDKLLQIIFVGQLELNEKLRLPTLKQLNQRISIRYEISPLDMEGTKNYIEHRIMVAGAASRVTFTRTAYKEIFSYSKGYPRLINLVCDRALLAGYNQQVETIDRIHVCEAIKSLLGEENKGYFFNRFVKNQLPLVASFLFFIAGLTFFVLSKMDSVKNNSVTIAANDVVSQKPASPASPPPAPVPEIKKAPLASPPVPKAATTVVEEFIADLDNTPPIEEVEEKEETEVPAKNVAKIPPAEVPEKEVPAPVVEVKNEDAPEAVPAVSKVKPGNYRIQVYSLKDRTEAEKKKEELLQGGFDAFLKKAVSAGQDWYIVYVGPFTDINSAKVNLKALKFSGREPILLSVTTAS
ncbi:MAG: AAA family ATPase [Nitrospinota bacterium]